MIGKTKIILAVIAVSSFAFFVFIAVVSHSENQEKTNQIGEWQEIEIREVAEYEKLDNYEILDTPSGTIVENKNIGLFFKVADNWNVERVENDTANVEVVFSSPDFQSKRNFPEKGCQIRSGAVYFSDENRPSIVARKISKEEEIDKKRQEIVFVSGFPALKTTKYENPETGGVFTVEKPFHNKIYFWNLVFASKEKSRCLNDFNEFLESVSLTLE